MIQALKGGVKMTNATDKQIYFLKSKGIDASQLSKEAASEIIKGFKEGPQATQQFPVVKPGQSYQQPNVYDKTSYYVAYAKDLCVAMIAQKAEADTAMDLAIEMIKRAKAELQ